MRVLALCTLFVASGALQPSGVGHREHKARAGQASLGSVRGASAHAHVQPLGFALLSSAHLGKKQLASTTNVCSAFGARPLQLAHAQRGAAIAHTVPLVRTGRTRPSLCNLRAAEVESKDADEWDSYAMLQESEDSVGEEDEEEDGKKAGESEEKSASIRYSKPAPEDDPRAVHVPAEEAAWQDDTSILQNSVFGQMGLPVELCRALKDMNINTPTAIQSASLPVSLAGESVLLCAETGSGKSLAFLLPLVARLKNDELVLGINARPKRPRAVVLAPTRELAAQLLGVAKGLSRHAKFSSVGVVGGSSMAAQAKSELICVS